MRLRSFTAKTMREAMAQVREAMGDDAIIISTHRNARGGGIQITAAIDPGRSGSVQAETAPPPLNRAELAERLARTLAWHGVPPRLVERLSMDALALPTGEPELALGGALDAAFRFQPLRTEARRPLMLVGPPGVGKTVTVAKLAAQATLAGEGITVVTTDTTRAGGYEQLDAFVRLLNRPLFTADDTDELAAIVRRAGTLGRVLIDTPGLNPFRSGGLDDIRGHASATNAEAILCLPAGGDAVEAGEIAVAFQLAGVRRMIATRLDVCRRLGGLLAAADTAALGYAAATVSAGVAHGMHAMTAKSLAQLLLRDPDSDRVSTLFEKAHAA